MSRPHAEANQRRPGARDSGRSIGCVSRWYWLLLVPIVLPLLTFLYNAEEPRLFGFPLFYWLQLAFVLVGSACCWIVYVRTKS